MRTFNKQKKKTKTNVYSFPKIVNDAALKKLKGRIIELIFYRNPPSGFKRC